MRASRLRTVNDKKRRVFKAASDLLQFTTERGHEEISEDVLLPLEDFKLKQA